MIKSSMASTFAERRRSMAALMAMLLATVVEVDAQPTTITPPTNAGDSVYTSTAGGFATLTAWNQVALIATIVVFLLLSALSGHEVYRIRYGRVLATNANANSKTTNANSTTNASTSITNNGTKLHPNYTTPKHGLATPVSAIDHTSDGTDDSAGAALSTGAEMRLRFFVLLFLASTIRVVSLIVEITTLKAMVASPAASLYSRLLSMFMWIPALLFVSMYGLVLLFWAQLCYACWGKAYPWPRRVFFVFNVVLYVVFVLLLFATSTSGSFWRACDLMLGAIYAVGLVGIVYYSVRLIQFFQQRGPDEEFFFDLPHTKRAVSPRQIVLRRIMAVCGLLSVLFVVKAAYLIGLGIGFVPSEETQYRSPVGVHHLAFEFTMHFFTEFVPCALLLVATRKQSHAASAAAASATGSLHATTPGVSGSYPHGLPSGSHSFVGLRGRNNSSHSAYQDDTQSVGSGSLTGYQFQAVQRSYGAGSFGSVQRATNAAYQSLDHSTTTSNGTTATSSSGVTSYA